MSEGTESTKLEPKTFMTCTKFHDFKVVNKGLEFQTEWIFYNCVPVNLPESLDQLKIQYKTITGYSVEQTVVDCKGCDRVRTTLTVKLQIRFEHPTDMGRAIREEIVILRPTIHVNEASFKLAPDVSWSPG